MPTNETPHIEQKMAKAVRLMPITDLKKYPNNARTHSPEQIDDIARSITEFGFTNPILTDGNDGIIAGHGRLDAAGKLGLRTVPVIELSHLDENQKRAYIIADNKLAEKAGWSLDVLTLELSELKDEGFDVDLTGFDTGEIDDLIGAMSLDGASNEDIYPPLNDGEKGEFTQMTFMLHADQAETVKRAVEAAQKDGTFAGEGFKNTNKNGNAIYVIACGYLAKTTNS